jgi:dienelactone hydrolase
MAAVTRATALLASALVVLAPANLAAQGVAEEVFLPKSGGAPVVIVLSGASGPADYRELARRIADLGYYSVLIDGKDVLTREQDGAANLRGVIAKAQAAPRGMPDKVVLFGFSRGGGAVLAHGAAMPELVKAGVAFYPATSWARDLAAVAARIQIPVLILAGQRDRYNNCCLIEHMRELEAASKARAAPLELVVYPQAGHAFNLPGRAFRGGDAADAWTRATQFLEKHHPPKALP